LYDLSGLQLKLLQTFPDAIELAMKQDKSRVAAIYFSSYLIVRIYDPTTYIETPTALSGFERIDNVDVLARKTSARSRSGDKAYDLDPGTGRSIEMDWLPGKVLQLPESGESWGLVRRSEGTLEIVDFDLRRTVLSLPKGERSPTGVAQVADNRRAVLVFPDKRLEIWDTASGSLLKQLSCPEFITSVKMSPDGKWLATAFLNGTLAVWNTATWSERALSAQTGAYTLTFSSDGTRLLVGTANDNAEVWDAQSWKLIGKLIGHALAVEDASLSPDGRRIVTASDDGTIRIWDAATLRELTTLTGHNRTVIRARFTDDGSSIISIDDKGTAKMWLTKTPAGLITPAMSAQAR
jgi:WD40 repeat protein